jgi:DNA-binding response OmpR family regulator
MTEDRTQSLVLIVEDEDSIRDLWVTELEEADVGYSVIGMGHPQAALPVLASGKVRAAIIDIGLPEMSGELLIAIARRFDPKLPILAVTGFDAGHYQHLCNDHVRVLQKPFRTSWLLSNLKAMLAQPPADQMRVASPSDSMPGVQMRSAQFKCAS